jgi:hypothetical protein
MLCTPFVVFDEFLLLNSPNRALFLQRRFGSPGLGHQGQKAVPAARRIQHMPARLQTNPVPHLFILRLYPEKMSVEPFGPGKIVPC